MNTNSLFNILLIPSLTIVVFPVPGGPSIATDVPNEFGFDINFPTSCITCNFTSFIPYTALSKISFAFFINSWHFSIPSSICTGSLFSLLNGIRIKSSTHVLILLYSPVPGSIFFNVHNFVYAHALNFIGMFASNRDRRYGFSSSSTELISLIWAITLNCSSIDNFFWKYNTSFITFFLDNRVLNVSVFLFFIFKNRFSFCFSRLASSFSSRLIVFWI